jgi:hypothetical protein
VIILACKRSYFAREKHHGKIVIIEHVKGVILHVNARVKSHEIRAIEIDIFAREKSDFACASVREKSVFTHSSSRGCLCNLDEARLDGGDL